MYTRPVPHPGFGEICPEREVHSSHPGPLTQMVKRSILIHNPHPHPVAFKVKTTAPKQYCVRPNSGRVESGENVEVQGKSMDIASYRVVIY